uniref:DZF domain-containing protein n=1 Tax=Gongylonema pulchrum TaxID=637853 RepID=A0A183ENG4_9BILA
LQICMHSLHCFGTAAQFKACREKISEMPTLFSSIFRLLQFHHLPYLACAAAECVCSLAVCTMLQMHLFQAGVEHSEDTNKQSLRNKLARCSCEALACLAGFREGTPDNDGVQRRPKEWAVAVLSELFGGEFKLSVHEKELIVGDIFVRIYNEQPNFKLQVSSLNFPPLYCKIHK